MSVNKVQVNQKDWIAKNDDDLQHVEKDVSPQIGAALANLDWSNLNGKVHSHTPDHVHSPLAVVASDDARCSRVGVEILRLGGHAVDAAIATALCLGVVSPTESGIGGGGFMVIRCASSSQAIAIDMRETAPGAATEDMYEDDPEAQVKGPLSIAVPGELVGMHRAWRMYGRLPWKTLFEPAIHFAKNGFQVYPYLAQDLEKFKDDVLADPGLTHVFAPHGKVLEVYETCYNTKLAETLEAVSKHGPHVIYRGLIGQKLAKDVKDKGGILTFEDLNNYKIKVTNVVEADFFGYKVLGMPPPSAGTVGLTMIAHVLENYGSSEALEGSLGLHRLAEATKYMLGMKMDLGDPDYYDISAYVDQMMSLDFAKKTWQKIDDDRTYPAEHYESRYKQIIDDGTSHLGVVDPERNAVAFTTSLNDEFGSKILSPSTGIILNNQMRDFSTPAEEREYFIKRLAYMSQFPEGGKPKSNSDLPPAIANLIEPGKRPLSSMTPLIILKDGQVAGVIGGSGGPNIIPAVTTVFLKHLVNKMAPRHSVHIARIYPKLLETYLDFGDLTAIDGEHIELSEEDKLFLEERGHTMTISEHAANCHLIVQNLEKSIDVGKLDNRRFGMLTGVADPRKDAKPAGM